MPPPDSNEFDSVLDEKAAEWIFEREEGFTPGRAEAFARWRNRDVRHAEAVARVQRTLAILDEMPEVRARLEARVASPKVARFGESGSGNHRRWFVLSAWTVGLAAALALGFVGWRLVVPSASPVVHFVSDSGAQRSLMLPDGSVLDLNVHTDVDVQFSSKERRIFLKRGEAHFQVAHDTARPFTVTAGGVSVRAVGTAFNVRRAGKGMDLVVVEGRVELRQREVSGRESFNAAAPLVVAGERVQLAQVEQPIAPHIEKIGSAELQSLLTWQNPLTNFADVPLREVVARFNRRNATKLILADADLGDRRIGGMIALDQVDAFVRLLEQDGDIVAGRTESGGIALRHAH